MRKATGKTTTTYLESGKLHQRQRIPNHCRKTQTQALGATSYRNISTDLRNLPKNPEARQEGGNYFLKSTGIAGQDR